MATSVPSNWSSLAGGTSTMGNPADLGPYRGMQQERGSTYDERANDAYDFGTGQRDYITGVGKGVTDQALDTSKTFSDWAKSDRAFWEGTYKPGMQAQMDYAMDYTTDSRKQANRAGAMAGNAITFDAAGDMAKRSLMGYGVDPSAGRFAGLDAGLAAKRAAAGAAAGTKSDRDTEVLGQEYLDRAIRTGAVLPGQAANEAGVSLAAGNAGANTAIATGDAARRATEPSGWVNAGDQALAEWKKSLLEQTQLGMKQNADAAEQRMAQAKLAEGSSSGIGSLIGAGAGILGSIYGGPVGGMIGSKVGSMVGGAIGKAARGGRIERFQRGGRVEFDPEGEGYDYEQAEAAGLSPQPVEDDDVPHWPSREPGSGLLLKGRKHPTFDHGVDVDRREGYGLEKQNGRYYTKKFADGGAVDNDEDPEVAQARQFAESLGGGMPAYADGGEVDEFDDEMGEGPMPPEEEMMEPPPQDANVVPPEASPSGGAETDDVHALVNEGEFIIPKKVTNWYGEKYFQKLIEKAYSEMSGPKTAEPEAGPPVQAMAMSPPSFESAGV